MLICYLLSLIWYKARRLCTLDRVTDYMYFWLTLLWLIMIQGCPLCADPFKKPIGFLDFLNPKKLKS